MNDDIIKSISPSAKNFGTVERITAPKYGTAEYNGWFDTVDTYDWAADIVPAATHVSSIVKSILHIPTGIVIDVLNIVSGLNAFDT